MNREPTSLDTQLETGTRYPARVVTADNLNYRTTPSTTGNVPLGKLRAGDHIKVLAIEGDWLKIEHPEDPSADPVYIHGKYTLELKERNDDQETIMDQYGHPLGKKMKYIDENTPPPADLEPVKGITAKREIVNYKLRKEPLRSFIEDLKRPAEAEGVYLHLTSAFRSYQRQEYIYRVNNKDFVEIPGFSEHHLGTTVDFTLVNRECEAFLWLLKNAFKVGWVPSQYFAPTVRAKETWHWRHVGVETAQKYYEKWRTEIEKEIVDLEGLKAEGKLKKNKSLKVN